MAIMKSSGCILVTSPVEDCCRPALDTLRHDGVNILVAPSGSEAIRQAARALPDIIILSRVMPDMSGLDACRDLRLDPDLVDLPVIVLSDDVTPERRLEALEAGADYFMASQAEPAEFCERIRNLLRLNRFRKISDLRAQLQRAKVGLRFMQTEPPSASAEGNPASRANHTDPAAAAGRRRQSKASMTARGAQGQFLVAVALTSVIPALSLVFVLFTVRMLPPEHLLSVALWPILVITGLLMALGICIMSKYPRNIVRMRRYLEGLAAGRMPEGIDLATDEDDLRAIELCMQLIIRQTEDRIRMIQQHEEALRIAERQRVMIESLGTACHHLGQPVTVMSVLMHMIEKQDMTRELRALVTQGIDSVTELCDLLKRLQGIAHYRTETYRTVETPTDRVDEFILDLKPNTAS